MELQTTWKWIDLQSLNELRVCDLIRPKSYPFIHVVTRTDGDGVLTAPFADVLDASEWEVYRPPIGEGN